MGVQKSKSSKSVSKVRQSKYFFKLKSSYLNFNLNNNILFLNSYGNQFFNKNSFNVLLFFFLKKLNLKCINLKKEKEKLLFKLKHLRDIYYMERNSRLELENSKGVFSFLKKFIYLSKYKQNEIQAWVIFLKEFKKLYFIELCNFYFILIFMFLYKNFLNK